MEEKLQRRHLLKQAGVTTTLIAAGYAGTSLGFAANETLNIGLIGVGGRCRELLRGLRLISGYQLTAVCDIWDKNLALGRDAAGPKAFATKEYRQLLERKDVDAVIVATPDHWHVPILYDACSAGKDVYVEKPLTHDLSEGAKALDAQNRFRRVVQVGTQQRSMPQFQKANEMVKAGMLGEIHKVRLSWNRNSPRGIQRSYGIDAESVDWQKFLGNAPQQPFDEYRFRNWRFFWDFGGGVLTDLMVHFIDVAHWFLDLEHPETATTIGDAFQTEGLWQTPDTVQTLMRYPGRQVQVYFEGTFVNARQAASLEFMGRNATLYLDRGRYEVIPERKKSPEEALPYSEWVLGKGPKGADFYDQPDGEMLHLANWIESIRARKKPNVPVEAGVSAAAAAHLGNRALRTGQVAHWSA